jgi:hypothetical protein
MDVAEFKLDEGEWEEQEGVLRIDNILRRRLGIPLKLDQLEQPWVSKQSRKPHDHKLQLRFRFKSTIAVEGSLLAVEKAPELTSVRLDGKELKVAKRGYFVDTDIDTIELPALGPGNHVLEMSAPFGFSSNLEWLYLLGDFGVQVVGRHATICAKPEAYHFGDLRNQGLPFYDGNVTMTSSLRGLNFGGQNVTLRIRSFQGLCLAVLVDGSSAVSSHFNRLRSSSAI